MSNIAYHYNPGAFFAAHFIWKDGIAYAVTDQPEKLEEPVICFGEIPKSSWCAHCIELGMEPRSESNVPAVVRELLEMAPAEQEQAKIVVRQAVTGKRRGKAGKDTPKKDVVVLDW